MISCVFQKVFILLKGKPLTLWGVSWLAVVLTGLVSAGFFGIPALGFMISIILLAALDLIFFERLQRRSCPDQ